MSCNLKTLLILLLALCLVAQAQEPAPRNSDEPTTGNISGRVVNENGQPLVGATLSVRAVNAGTNARTTATDAEGNFRVNGLEPALFIVSASSPAYTTAFSDPTAPPRYYRVGDSVTIELVRGGVITGAVTNALGEPVIHVRVRAALIRDAKGEPSKWASLAFREGLTDDRGVYRIYGLPPGGYLVATGGGSGFSPSFSPYDSDVPTYAPSSTRDNAAEISVRGGEESTADIRYRGEPGHTVSGTVKVSGAGGATVVLIPATGTFMPGGNAFQPPGGRGFAFNGIADGDYDLVAQEFMTAQAPGVPMASVSERTRITVKGANVTGIELLTRPLASVSGRVLLEASKDPQCEGKRAPLLSETLVRVQRHEKDVEKDNSAFPRIGATSGSPDRNGEFVLRNLMPGRYQFEPRFYARYWYLQSLTLTTPTAKSQKVDAAANWTAVKFGDQLTNLTVTLAAGAASIRGRLAPAEPPAAVYLVPAEQDKAEDVLRFFVTDTASDGAFAFNNLPPGRYFVFARPADPQLSTQAKLRQPEAATARAKLRRTAQTQKTEIELKPCQNVTDYELKQ